MRPSQHEDRLQRLTAHRDDLPPVDDDSRRENHRWLAAWVACVLVVWLVGLALALWV